MSLRLLVASATLIGMLWPVGTSVDVYRLMEAERDEFATYLDTIERRLARVPELSREEKLLLRRSFNQDHLHFARAYGGTPEKKRANLLDAALDQGYEALPNETPYYVRTRAGNSIPYLTPDATAALDSIGVHFQRRLATRGLPAFKFAVTSVLRSSEDQRRLRRRNRNAAKGRSSHEFGTTFDLSQRRYVYAGFDASAMPISDELPAWAQTRLRRSFERQANRRFQDAASRYRTHIKALLGRTLIDLEDRGILITLYEYGQPVFHTTVSRRLVFPERRDLESIEALELRGMVE
ncbi:MAG: DUF5715 family protein [Bacteroidota bacterium]